MNDQLTITRPDDWHLHVRTGDILKTVANHTARCFGRALIMPNLQPPVKTAKQAEQYRESILQSISMDQSAIAAFDPVMTLYLTDNTTSAIVKDAGQSPHVVGFKLYPAGATTNADSGVTHVTKMMHIFEAMADNDLVLQVHGEVTDPHVDIFDREAIFIEQILEPIHREIPQLRIVLEHITTRQGVEFVTDSSKNVAATITPQHLRYSRNDIFKGGIRPHYYCLPILKRDSHRQSLVDAAISGNPSFFLGTDSAPHIRGAKENSCGCAGMYSAHAAIELYAEVFETMDALDKLEAFASFHGADFYQVPRNSDQITLLRRDWVVPEEYPVAGSLESAEIVPMKAGESMRWQLQSTIALHQ